MANIKTSNEASGAPIEKTDLFRIARSGDNYKLTTQEIFTETVSRSTLQNKMTSSQLIPGRIYKVPNPSTSTLTDLMYVQAVSNTQIDSNVAIEVDNVIYPAYYDFANDVFGYIDTTYANLRTTMLGGKLVPGMTYRISDYVSKNFLNGQNCAFRSIYYGSRNPSYTPWGAGSGDPNYNAFDVYTSSVEPLYVKATAVDKLDVEARSELYPRDIIYYDAYSDKLGIFGSPGTVTLQWDAVNNYAYIDMPAGAPVLYGQIFTVGATFNDGVSNYVYKFYTPAAIPGLNKTTEYTYPTAYYTYPIVTSDVLVLNNGTKLVFPNLTSTNVAEIISLNIYTVPPTNIYADTTGYIYKRTDPIYNITCSFDFRNRKYRRFEVDLSNVDPIFDQTLYVGISDNFTGGGTTGNYIDFPIFSNYATNVSIVGVGYENYSQDNIIFQTYTENVQINGTECRDNTFGGTYISDLTMPGSYSYENVILSEDTSSNIFDHYCNQNIIICYAFTKNKIFNYFYNNFINGSYVANNLIQATFGYNKISSIGLNPFGTETFSGNHIAGSLSVGGFQFNTITSWFEDVYINSTFNNNTIDEFGYSQIYQEFTYNTIGTFVNTTVKTNLSSLNFTSATHVNSYNPCEILSYGPSHNKVLVYTDGTQYLFVSPTS